MEKISIKELGLYLITATMCGLLILTIGMCTSCVKTDIEEKVNLEGTLVPSENYIGWDYCGFYLDNVIETHTSVSANGHSVYWIVYTDLDADFNKEVISMGESTFTLLLEALDNIQNTIPYSKEWKEICDEYQFTILYKGKTNILITIDKD